MKKKLERPTLTDFRNCYKIAVIKILGKTNRSMEQKIKPKIRPTRTLEQLDNLMREKIYLKYSYLTPYTEINLSCIKLFLQVKAETIGFLKKTQKNIFETLGYIKIS